MNPYLEDNMSETFRVEKELLPQRCVVCHQSDQFDPEYNICKRCGSIDIPTNINQVQNNLNRRLDLIDVPNSDTLHATNRLRDRISIMQSITFFLTAFTILLGFMYLSIPQNLIVFVMVILLLGLLFMYINCSKTEIELNKLEQSYMLTMVRLVNRIREVSIGNNNVQLNHNYDFNKIPIVLNGSNIERRSKPDIQPGPLPRDLEDISLDIKVSKPLLDRNSKCPEFTKSY